jgi:replication fork protection complex subunit Tof1/Swi1
MLEKYSKTKAFMFVRKRRAARRKRKLVESVTSTGEEGGPSTIPEEYAGEVEEGEGEGIGGADRDAPSYREHTFTFQSFEKVRRATASSAEMVLQLK